MASLKPVKASQKTNITKPSKMKKKSANKVASIDYDCTLNYKHNLGSKPLPEGGIYFFLNAQTNWLGTWNHRLNKTAFIAKANGWSKNEFIELFEKYAPDPKDSSCLAVVKSVFDSKVSTNDSSDGNDSKKAFRNLLIKDITEEIETFHTSDQIPFARLSNQPLPNVVGIRSALFSGFIKKLIYEKRNFPLTKTWVDELPTLFEAIALHQSEPEKVHLRVARDGSDIILCLGGDSGCVRIFPNHSKDISVQGFEIIKKTKVKFLNSKGCSNIPSIVHSDILPIKHVINVMFERFINITLEEDRILFIAALVSYLVSANGDFIFLVFEGEQGSGKTTAMEFAKKLIDPSPIEKNLLPKNESDIYLIAQHLFVLNFDNVSGISKNISDCLCTLSTGGASLARLFYSNRDISIMNAKCPVLINGIEASPERADLMGRSVVFDIEPLSAQKSKAKMYEDFDENWPHILSGLVQIASYALARAPEIEEFGPFRMTDYAKVGCATAEYLGYDKSFFIDAYQANRDKSSKLILENDVIARQLLNCFRPGDKFEGTATKLYELLKPYNDYELARLFPKNTATLSKSLRRIMPVLRTHGFEVDIDRRTSEYREIKICMPPKENIIWSKLNSKNPQAQRQFGSPNGGQSEDLQ